MAERFKAHAWKVCIRAIVSWVRIPLSPPFLMHFLKKNSDKDISDFVFITLKKKSTPYNSTGAVEAATLKLIEKTIVRFLKKMKI